MMRCCWRPPRGPCSAADAGRWPISSTIVLPRRPRCRRSSTSRPIATEAAAEPAGEPEGLLFWNGFGGFTGDGREYVIVIDGTPPGGPALPPAPWTNVLANPGFGCLVTEAGLGYTWAGNSQMNRLTPWSNDPVSDPPGEVIYLRDEETGEVWTPTPLPRGPRAAVTVRHGQGYTRYTHDSHGLDQELLVLVPPDDPVKLVCLTRAKPRRPAAPPVGDVSMPNGCSAPSARTPRCRWSAERDPETGAVLARNAWAGSFAGQVAFWPTARRPQDGDRRSHGVPRPQWFASSAPAALGRVGLSGRVGAGARPGRGGDDGHRRWLPARRRSSSSSWARRRARNRSAASSPPTPPPVEPGRCWPRCRSDGITS